MVYDFVCPDDKSEETLKLTLEEYSKLDKVACPQCGNDMRRKFSPPAIQIK